jgi:hypothetical protein
MADSTRNGDTQPPPHRGRVQAQGGGTEKSEKWAQDDPPKVSEVLSFLDRLEAQLTPAERRLREEALQQAREYVRNAGGRGGLHAPVHKSFPRKRLRGGIRVDLEVIAGRACVPG